MSGIAVHIAIEPEGGGSPVSLARVVEDEVLKGVARAAIDGALSNARRAARLDRTLGKIRLDEARSMERYFRERIPGFSDRPGQSK